MITFIGFDQISPGGGQQLVINLTLGLYLQGYKTKIYCSKESFVYKQLADLDIDFVHIDSDTIIYKDLSQYIHSSDVIILMYFSIKLLTPLIHSNPKIVFYSIYPEIFLSYSYIFGLPIKKNLLTFIYSLDKGKALYFMDFSNYKTLHKFNNFTSNDLSFIPVPIKECNNNSYTFKPKKELVTITYIGRGDEKWKIYPVIKIYKDLLNTNASIDLRIITTDADLFRKMLAPYLAENKEVQVAYIIGLSGESLANYLIKNSDLHFSMGTSALEAAKHGIPTILMDYSHSHFPNNYLYRWIYEENSTFNLGYLIEPSQIFKGIEMKEIIRLINNPIAIQEISTKCFDYSKSNHSLETTVEALLKASTETSYKVEDLFKNSLYLRVKKYVLRFTQNLT